MALLQIERPHPLRPIVGTNPRRLIVLAVVYLDDSGTHGSSPIITMAGYLFAAGHWEQFETKAARYLKEQQVPVFHAKDFNNRGNRTPFAGWSLPKQVGFADGWFEIAKAHVLLGITVSLPKARYENVRKEARRNQNVSAYGQCLNGVLAEFKDDGNIWSLAKSEGLTVVLELGNKNNEGLKQFFHKARKDLGHERELKTIGECAKEDCVAIQLADFLAFYSWHYAVRCFEAGHGKLGEMPSFLHLAKEKVRTIGHLGADFHIVPKRRRRQRDGAG